MALLKIEHQSKKNIIMLKRRTEKARLWFRYEMTVKTMRKQKHSQIVCLMNLRYTRFCG